MRNEIYSKLTEMANEVLQATREGHRLTPVLTDKMTRIVGHAQASVNRGLLGEALYLASRSDDPMATLQEKWEEMVRVIGEANQAKLVLAATFNRTFVGQEQASVVVLPIGEGRTFTPFNDLEGLDRALRGESELVAQLMAQGRNRLSIGALMAGASLLTQDHLAHYREFLVTMAKYRKNDDWVVRVGTKRTAINQFALKGLEALEAARQGKEPKAADLHRGLSGIVAWMADTALNHRHMLKTIPVEDGQGRLSRFWVEGRVDYNTNPDYYAAEEPVKVRFAHFEQREALNNKYETVAKLVSEAVDSWDEVAGWLATVRQVHNAARQGERPLVYRLRSGLETEHLMDVLDGARRVIADRDEKKEAEWAAKRLGGQLKESRDAREGWEAATKGVLNAAQKAQLAKLRREMGFDLEAK